MADCKIVACDIETFPDSANKMVPYAIGARYGGEGNFTLNRPVTKMF